MIKCTNCGRPYLDGSVAYECEVCGGVYDFAALPAFNPGLVEPEQPGIWRYRHTFGLPEDAPQVTLGEGNTSLKWVEAFGKQVALKLEYENPSGSQKDRGVALMVSYLKGQGVTDAIEDSSGNAGASFALYAREAGIRAVVHIPDYASGPKRKQIVSYGAVVVRILGARSVVTEVVRKKAGQGAVYASHAYQPHLTPGYATIAYELYEQMGAPGTVIAPVGQGSLLLGIARGFRQLKNAGLIDTIPRLVGVQALACGPIWAVATMGPAGLQWVREGETLAEGVRVAQPVRADQLLQEIMPTGGAFVPVAEETILPARDQLASLGFKVEPTSAIVWDALRQIASEFPEPFALVLTGAGYKTNLPYGEAA